MRYLLFSWHAYEAMGGAGDLVGGYPTIDSAVEAGQKHVSAGGLLGVAAHILDVEALTVVMEYRDNAWVAPE